MRRLRELRHRLLPPHGGGVDVVTGVGVLALVAWPLSWYLIWREIFRWQHMTKTLRFAAPGVPAGMPEPKPGFPVRILRAVAVLSPVVAVACVVLDRPGAAAARG